MSRQLEVRLRRLEAALPERRLIFYRSFFVDSAYGAKTASSADETWVRNEDECEEAFLDRVRDGLVHKKTGDIWVSLE